MADSLSCFQLRILTQHTGTWSSLITWSHPCMADYFLTASLRQFICLGVAQSMQQAYTSRMNSYLHFYSQFDIVLHPASSLTLQFICTHLTQHIYKSIKASLARIHLVLDLGHLDPTSSEPLYLVVRGIQCLQSNFNSHHRLSITIDLLRILRQ